MSSAGDRITQLLDEFRHSREVMTAELSNLSAGGCLAELPGNLESGDHLLILLSLPNMPVNPIISRVVRKGAPGEKGVCYGIRFESLDDNSQEELAHFVASYIKQKLREGEIGCFASHFRAWEAAAGRTGPTLVMEDDLLVLDGFRAALAAAEGVLAGHPLVRLYVFALPPRSVDTPLGGDFRLTRYDIRVAGSQCYLVSPAGAAALVDVAGAGPIPSTGFANLPGTTCTVMVFSADAEGFAELRVTCS